MNRDKETEEAKEMANEIDILDINGVVELIPYRLVLFKVNKHVCID
jgi:hypothetical protein